MHSAFGNHKDSPVRLIGRVESASLFNYLVNTMHSLTESGPGSTPGRNVEETRPPELELLQSPEQLYALRMEWNALLEQSANRTIFMTWEWIWTWWEAFDAEYQPWILALRESAGKQLVGIAPFLRRRTPIRGGFCRELSLIGACSMAGDHLDVILRTGWEAIVVREIADFLKANSQHWDVLALDWLPADSKLASLLRAQNRRPAMAWPSFCPFLSLPDSWDALLPRLEKSLRRKLRTSPKRLQDAGVDVEYRMVSLPEELPTALEELFRMHQAVREARGDRGNFHNAAARKFHALLAQRLLEKGWLRFSVLKVNGRIVAALYCFRYDDTVSFLTTGYDREWAQYRPGLLIMAHSIHTSIDEGAREYDFLRGLEPYKSEWTHRIRTDLRLRLAANAAGSLLVLAYRTAYAARLRFRRWRGRIDDQSAFVTGESSYMSESTQE